MVGDPGEGRFPADSEEAEIAPTCDCEHLGGDTAVACEKCASKPDLPDNAHCAWVFASEAHLREGGLG